MSGSRGCGADPVERESVSTAAGLWVGMGERDISSFRAGAPARRGGSLAGYNTAPQAEKLEPNEGDAGGGAAKNGGGRD